jgi:ATP-dependent protease ClpP protease subunit
MTPKTIQMTNKPYVIMKNDAGNKVDVNLYGEVVESVPIDWWTGEKVEGLFIELKQFLSDIDSLSGADEVTFHINSMGGDVEAGIAIYNKITAMEAKTTTIVEGLAASAASIIAQAGDTRIMGTGSQMMIHGASIGLVGYYNVNDLKKHENALAKINESVANLYATRSGRDQDHILNMMLKDKWMTGDDAINEGFADELVTDKLEAESVQNKARMLVVNGITHNLHGLPMPEITLNGEVIVSDAKGDAKKINPERKEEKAMTLQELKDTQPELVNELLAEAKAGDDAAKAEAVKAALDADRKRMMEIDSISAAVGDPELINKAKYLEPMEAAQVALMAMQAQTAKGNAFLSDRAEETSKNSVEINANAGIEDHIADDEAKLNALINKLKEEK